jgi:hypothetical protein
MAPLTYRPQAVVVSERKADFSAVTPKRMAPPVYRSQPVSGRAAMQPGFSGNIQLKGVLPSSPPAYRCPGPKPVVMPKMGASGLKVMAPQAIQQNRVPATPPQVFRPQVPSKQMTGAASRQSLDMQAPGVPGRGIAFHTPVLQRVACRNESPGGRTLAQPKSVVPSGAAQHTLPHQATTSGTRVVQRIIESYLSGTTLRRNYKVMKGLSLSQMDMVQQLHDDTRNSYSIEVARAIATKVLTGSNPYEWEIESKASYAVTDPNVQSILDNFGAPTTDVVKKYDELASRVGYEARQGGKLSQTTLSDVDSFFEAQRPLHFQFNDYLNAAWTDNLDNYSGSKKEIPLYSVMRSAITKDFKAEHMGTSDLNAVLREVSGRPAEIHHLLYKAKHPGLASNTANLVLSQRSESEKRSGPGQHELMHMVASGQHNNKFNELRPEFTDAYKKYMTGKGWTL